MINLLPPATKESVSYARRNAQLLRLCFAIVGVTLGAIVIIGLGHFYLASSTARYQKHNTELSDSLRSQDIDIVKSEIQDLSGSVKLALQVLSREILFSKLLSQAGSVMPAGAALSALEISNDQKGIDIVADVQNYQAGTQVQINLADPDNKIFEKVDLVSVECSGTNPNYPCQARLRGLLGDNSQYLFINNHSEGRADE